MSGNYPSEIPGGKTRGTVSTALVRFILGALREAGADSGSLARRIGLPTWVLADDTARVPMVQMASLWQLSLAELGDPHLGLHAGFQWRYGNLGLYDYLWTTAATFGESLAIGTRYIGIINGAAASSELIDEDDQVTVVYGSGQGADPDVSAVAAEFGASVLISRTRHATGGDVTPLHVGLSTPAPASHRELAEAFGARRVDFGQERSTITFARSHLDLPLPHADPGLAAVLLQHAGTVLAATASTSRWIDRFRQILAAQLGDSALSLPTVAGRLGMSPRTLQRRLESNGTGWREEVATLRYEHATRLVRDGMPRSVIAAQLGYSDTRALRAAIRRWNTGSHHPGH